VRSARSRADHRSSRPSRANSAPRPGCLPAGRPRRDMQHPVVPGRHQDGDCGARDIHGPINGPHVFGQQPGAPCASWTVATPHSPRVVRSAAWGRAISRTTMCLAMTVLLDRSRLDASWNYIAARVRRRRGPRDARAGRSPLRVRGAGASCSAVILKRLRNQASPRSWSRWRFHALLRAGSAVRRASAAP